MKSFVVFVALCAVVAVAKAAPYGQYVDGDCPGNPSRGYLEQYPLDYAEQYSEDNEEIDAVVDAVGYILQEAFPIEEFDDDWIVMD